MNRVHWFWIAAVSVGTTFACSQGDHPLEPSSGIVPNACVDADHDGYGDNCKPGPDCNDSDPNVGNECFVCAGLPSPGCSCDEPGLRAPCGQVESRVEDQVVCGLGETVCTDGTWSECVMNNSITLLPNGDPKSNTKTQTLGGAGKCDANPCDPYCNHWTDTPSGLSDPTNGIVANDGGITTPASSSTPTGGGGSCTGGSTIGSCSHHLCATGTKLTSGCDGSLSCVSSVCASKPSCCTSSWDASCVALIPTKCQASCNVDVASKCVLCYQDSVDHDGDGYSFAQGDCKDCDPNINPGAFDIALNGVDEDCDGTADNEITTCDGSLAFSTDDPMAYAKAVDLCSSSTSTATGKNKIWGVLSAQLVQADGVTTCSKSLQRAITSKFGDNVNPTGGSKMAVFSSGTARDRNDPGFIDPSGQFASYNANTHVNPPSGFPKNAKGCPSGSAANDSCGLKVTIRAPTNAKSFAYDFDFFSTEYSEWLCTAYNDTFIALYTGALNPFSDKNISFDANDNPMSVNAGFFGIPGSPTATSHPHLTNTGFDGVCSNYGYPKGLCGGATGFLTTTAPVKPGEVITLHFSIWDTGDHVWDSTVLMDHFRWSTEAATIQTLPSPPTPPAPKYSVGNFFRDYDGQEACPATNQGAVWGHWSWTATTPTDSQIEYYVRTSNTQAGLATATEVPLRFTNPPGPSALAGQAAVAKKGSPDTQNGSAIVTSALKSGGQPTNLRFVRIRSKLVPSTAATEAPTLNAWDLQVSCQPDE